MTGRKLKKTFRAIVSHYLQQFRILLYAGILALSSSVIAAEVPSVRSYFPGGKITIKNSKAFKAADKMFQFNTSCSVRNEYFVGDDMGKLVKNMWHKEDVPFYVDLNNVEVTNVRNAVVQSNNPKCQVRHHNLSYTFKGRLRPERVFRNIPPENVTEY